MNILIAPNAFKNSLDAQAVAVAIALGLQQSKADCECRLFPVGDGGDGTGELLIRHLNGEMVPVQVHDALGRLVASHFGLVDNARTAIIEMADASGLRLLKATELNPLHASSYGTGELVKAALDKGVNKIIVGMGGSATVDGGAGILQALGIRFINVDDEVVTGGPLSFSELKHIDTTGLDERILNCEISILCDVDNKLTGPEGAAAMFGPQKGADQVDVMLLDSLLLWFATIQAHQTGRDIINLQHGGTAGGAAAGMYAFLDAKLISGANSFLNLTHFDQALKNVDLVITGEGSIDEQTLHGKAPAAVAMAAKQRGIKVVGVAGKVPENPIATLNHYFDRLISINKIPVDLETALKNSRQNLIAVGKEIGDLIADA